MFRGEAGASKGSIKKITFGRRKASGAARFSDSFLGFECVPLSVWQRGNVQWLRGVMMLFKGKRGAIMGMDFIQQISAAKLLWHGHHPKTLAAFSKSLNFPGQPEGVEHFLKDVFAQDVYRAVTQKWIWTQKLSEAQAQDQVELCDLLLPASGHPTRDLPGFHCSALAPGIRHRQGMCVVRSSQAFFRPGICFSFGTFCPNRFVHP